MDTLSRSRQDGFSLTELLVTVAIVALLTSFVARMASAAMNAARTSSGVSSLYASLTRARSFAASAGVDVVMCPSEDGAHCAAGYHWENGWIAFAATQPGSDRSADEPIIVKQPALPSKVHLVTSSGRTRIRFQPSGSNAGSNATFTICDARGAKAASAHAMANNGNLHEVATDPAYVAQACAGI